MVQHFLKHLLKHLTPHNVAVCVHPFQCVGKHVACNSHRSRVEFSLTKIWYTKCILFLYKKYTKQLLLLYTFCIQWYIEMYTFCRQHLELMCIQFVYNLYTFSRQHLGLMCIHFVYYKNIQILYIKYVGVYNMYTCL